MKFQCQECKTRYSIADAKVRGKILKIRCKNCEAIITVREGMEVEDPKKRTGGTLALNVPKVPVETKAPPQARGAPRPKATTDGQDNRPERATAPPQLPPEEANPPALDDEWFVSVDGVQEGPFTREAARRRIQKKQPDEEMHGWREGFEQWLPVEDIPEFKTAVPRAPSERLPIPVPEPTKQADAPPAAAEPSADSAPALSGLARAGKDDDAVGDADSLFGAMGQRAAPSEEADDQGDDNLDFDIGEASRVVRMPMLAPGMGAASAGAGLGAPGLPGMAGPAAGATPQAGGTVAPGGGDPAARAAALRERAQHSRVEAPKRKSRSAVLLAILGVSVAVIAGVAVVYLTTEGDTGRTGGGRFQTDLDVYDQGPGLPGSKRPTARAGEEPSQQGGRTGGRTNPRWRDDGPGRVRNTNDGIAGGAGPGISGPTGTGVGDKGFANLDDALRPLTPDDVVSTASQGPYQTGIRLCYQHALKKDPTLNISRMNVTIGINSAGRVSSVQMAQRPQTQLLTQCLESRIKRWQFRKSTEGLNAEFPLLFARKN